jgi:hypothetical protein
MESVRWFYPCDFDDKKIERPVYQKGEFFCHKLGVSEDSKRGKVDEASTSERSNVKVRRIASMSQTSKEGSTVSSGKYTSAEEEMLHCRMAQRQKALESGKDLAMYPLRKLELRALSAGQGQKQSPQPESIPARPGLVVSRKFTNPVDERRVVKVVTNTATQSTVRPQSNTERNPLPSRLTRSDLVQRPPVRKIRSLACTPGTRQSQLPIAVIGAPVIPRSKEDKATVEENVSIAPLLPEVSLGRLGDIPTSSTEVTPSSAKVVVVEAERPTPVSTVLQPKLPEEQLTSNQQFACRVSRINVEPRTAQNVDLEEQEIHLN